MTLIIGCTTPDFGIIAGDTQLTTKGLDRQDKVRRSVEIKVKKYSSDLMFGILGNWGWFYPDKKGSATYMNDYDILQRGILNPKVTDKLTYLKKFLIGREKINATSIYVKRNIENFELDAISNNGDSEDLNSVNTDNKKLLFNEPFFSIQANYVQERILTFIEVNKINDSLLDNLFLLNNIILQIISEGKEFSISNEGTSYLDVKNTVGGYVTIQIITKTGIHHLNCLYSHYNYDFNCLIDKTTNPFSTNVDYNKCIRYVDNLGMIVKNTNNCNIEDDLKKVIIELCSKQIKYIYENNILSFENINLIINHANTKYNLEIPIIVEVPNNEVETSLKYIYFDEDEVKKIDIEFLMRFI